MAREHVENKLMGNFLPPMSSLFTSISQTELEGDPRKEKGGGEVV